ncbi:MAG: NPCBM/NEW2 domain-containing protein [Opitutaceae bacterium]|nr:NPCBM/NEW2 domain-containing protein [Opitutaceae bacterium]
MRPFPRWVGAIIVLLSASFGGTVDPAAINSARALYEKGRFGEAQSAFEKLFASAPKDPEVNFHLGELALHRNEPEKAVAFFASAIAAAPNVSRFHHRLGDAYGRSAQKASVFSAFGLARKCLASYRRAVELDPANIDARYSLFVFYRNAPGIIGGGSDKAATEADAIKKLDPDRGRVAWAALYVSQEQYDHALATLAEFRPLDLATVQGDSVYLSDVAWTDGKVGWGQPARNHTWFDEKSHPGVVLIVHGRLYGKGLYAHSPSRYAFALDGKWKVFTATVGLRDGAHPQGSAIFTVRGDGRELFRSAMLRVDASKTVNVDVAGVKELELLTEGGEGHNHNSWAIWAEPRLRR